MNLYGNYMQYAVSMKDSTLELTGGDAKAEGEGNMGAVFSMMYHKEHTIGEPDAYGCARESGGS